MPKYYYVAKLSRYHAGFRIHSQECGSLPTSKGREFLGSFYHERDAVQVSRLRHPGAVPCPECFDNPRKYLIKL